MKDVRNDETVSKIEKSQAVKKKQRQMLHAVRKGYSDYVRKRTKGHELPFMGVSSKSDNFQPFKRADCCSGWEQDLSDKRPPSWLTRRIAATAVCRSIKGSWKASFLPLPYSYCVLLHNMNYKKDKLII